MNGDINTGAGIDWTKLGISSTVSSAEIGYVDGVTSSIQTQLDARLSKTGGTMSGAIAMGTSKITGMGDPTSAQDAATKAYTDLQITNLINGAGAAYKIQITNTLEAFKWIAKKEKDRKAMIAQKEEEKKEKKRKEEEEEKKRKEEEEKRNIEDADLSFLLKYDIIDSDRQMIKEYIEDKYGDSEEIHKNNLTEILSELEKHLKSEGFKKEDANSKEKLERLKSASKDANLMLKITGFKGGSRKRSRRRISATRSHRGGSRKRPRRRISATRSHRGGSRKRPRRRM
jgi:hypothetical protein